MEIGFEKSDLLFIYGTFLRHIRELEQIKLSPESSWKGADIDKDIVLYRSVTEKIEKTYPRFAEMKGYSF